MYILYTTYEQMVENETEGHERGEDILDEKQEQRRKKDNKCVFVQPHFQKV